MDVEPFVHYYLCYSEGLLIRYYKCLAELRKGISQNQDISLLSLDGSMVVKSMQRRSNCPLATIELGCVLGPT